jgi:pyrroloquinoline-quinone synthase
MDSIRFWERAERILEEYDLLHHPYYEAWTAGVLSRDDLREYAAGYYHHVASFPLYLHEFAHRLAPGELRQTVLQNLWEEMGVHSGESRAHHLVWLDFAGAVGASPVYALNHKPTPETAALIQVFFSIVRSRGPADAVAAFYAYESQVPKLAGVKAAVLSSRYGLNEAACEYFNLHTVADVGHAASWHDQLQKMIEKDSLCADSALNTMAMVATARWNALNGFYRLRSTERTSTQMSA